MSEHITHIAIADDLARLVLATPAFPPSFHRAARNHPRVLQLGGVTRQADQFSPRIIHDAAQTHASHPPGSPPHTDADKKLAFVFGSLSHRAIDRHMKPVFQHFKSQPDALRIDGKVVNECTIYCDCLILHHVFGFPSQPTHFAPGLLNARQPIDEALRASLQRVLIQLHTFRPDHTDIHAFLSQLFDKMQEFEIRLDLYVQTFTHPDPAKWHKYLTETHFYDPADPLLALCRTLQHSPCAALTDGALPQALAATTPTSSRYAQALQHAYAYVQTAADLYTRQITPDQAAPRLDIGVPELSLGYIPRQPPA